MTAPTSRDDAAPTPSGTEKSRGDGWRRVRGCADRARDRCAALYTRYILEIILRRKALPPSKDGRRIPLRPHHRPPLIDERRGTTYVGNRIRSARYTVWDFLPKQFLFQATRLNNLYFLAIGIPQAIPGISTTGNYTTILPLLVFLCLTVAKEGYDDYRRHRLDTVENESIATVLRAKGGTQTGGWRRRWKTGTIRPRRTQEPPEIQEEETDPDDVYAWAPVPWHAVAVGDIVRLRRNDAVPADLALLSASNEHGVAYVETAALDGESNLKSKQAPPAFDGCGSIAGIRTTQAEFVVEDPNRNLYDFTGRATLGEKCIPLTVHEVLLRGSVLRNTRRAVGVVLHAGEECKIRMNANHHPRAKKPRLEAHANRIVLALIAYVVLLAVGSAVGYAIWHRTDEIGAWYLNNHLYNVFVSVRDNFLGFLIMYNNVIPLAMYVSLEIVKIGQMLLVQSDAAMYDAAADTPAVCNTNTILENLGQVSYVLSDKTGTLTENVMHFRKMSIAGCAVSHHAERAEPAASGPTKTDDDDHADHRATEGKEPRKSMHAIREPAGNPISPTTPRKSIHAIREPVGNTTSPTAPRPSMAGWGRPSLGGDIERTVQELTSEDMLDHIRQDPTSHFAQNARDFILGLALCHTALPERTPDGGIEFEASSPDEVALVRAARDLGVTLTARSSRSITLVQTVAGGADVEQTYDILDVIEFSSQRKRMSIILRCPNGDIWMLCKGADTVIVPRLQHASLATRKSQDIRRSRQLERDLLRKHEPAEGRRSFSARLSLALSARASMDGPSRPVRMGVDPRLSLDLPPTPFSPSPLRQMDAVVQSAPMSPVTDPDRDDALVFTRCFRHLDDFATEGLRTLLFAQKKIPPPEYDAWKTAYHAATTALGDRPAKIEAAAERIEHGFELLGASAIEDQLQAGVPATIAKLRRAGMKIWMLTGDKRETALTVAHAACLGPPLAAVHALDATRGDVGAQIDELALHVSTEPGHQVAVIDGHTLAVVEEDPALKARVDPVLLQMDAVICCRASPAQKADVVRAIRRHVPGALTLAIGDGSNDLAMIQAAHVGVGISGKEGRQAARVADYSIAQFRFLQRLLLVHGRWNYVRTAKFILWTFFKEFFFYMMQAVYQRYDGYTGSSLYESWSLTVLNTLFTSLCVIVPGIFEQDLRAETLLAVPELYAYAGPRNQSLNMLKFLRWMALAAAEGLIVWYVVWAAWGHFNYSSDNGAFALGNLCFSLGIAWQNIKLLLLETHHQTTIVYVSFGITFGGWWAWNAFLAKVYTSNLSPFDVRHGFTQGFGKDLNWWATFVLVLVILVVFEVALKAAQRYLRAMRVARAWKSDQPTPYTAWTGPEPTSVRARVRAALRAWWTHHRVPSQWDLGVWQEIEAEPGARAELQALAATGGPWEGGPDDDDDDDKEAA